MFTWFLEKIERKRHRDFGGVDETNTCKYLNLISAIQLFTIKAEIFSR